MPIDSDFIQGYTLALAQSPSRQLRLDFEQGNLILPNGCPVGYLIFWKIKPNKLSIEPSN